MSSRNFSNKPSLQDNIQNVDFQVNVKKNIYKPVFGHNDEPGTLTTRAASVTTGGITTTTTILVASTGRGNQGPVGPAGSQGFQGPGNGGGGGGLVSKTHAQLITLQQNNQLVAGQQYLLTDYQTIYVQPNTSILKTDAVPEPLILTALGTATFSSSVQSYLYPNDEIEYDINNTFVQQTPRNGWITWRKDDRNNSCFYDSRTVLCNTLASVGTYSVATFTSGEDFSGFNNLQINVLSIDRNTIVSNLIGQSQSTNSATRYLGPFIVTMSGYNNTNTIINLQITDNNGTTNIQVGTMSTNVYANNTELYYAADGNVIVQAYISNTPQTPTPLPNLQADTYQDAFTFETPSSNCFSNVIEKDTNNTYTDGINNNTIRNSSNITFGPNCTDNTVGDGSYNIELEGDNHYNDISSTNFVGGSCYGNKFLRNSSNNVVGSQANDNIIGGNFNRLLDGANGNTLQNSNFNFLGYTVFNNVLINNSNYNSLIDDSDNNLLDESSFNFLGYGPYSNRLYNSSYNHIDNDANYCDFANNCQYNTITSGSARCSLGQNCQYNYMNDGQDNVLGDYSSYNSFTSGSSRNKFGQSCNNNNFDQSGGNDNKLSNYCQNNVIGGNFNTFDQSCTGNILHGGGSNYNVFGENCNGNIIFYSSRNVFGQSCATNTLDGGSSNDNLFSDNCSNIYMYFSARNQFGSACSGINLLGGGNNENIFDQSCTSININNGSNNKFGQGCYNNTFYGGGNNFNVFDDSCSNNTLFSSSGNKFGQGSSNNSSQTINFVDNIFASSFSNNVFGVSGSNGVVSGNIIGSNFESNQFPNGGIFQGNIIKDNFSNNIINMTQSSTDPQSFNYNYIEDNVTGITYPSQYNNRGPWVSTYTLHANPINYNEVAFYFENSGNITNVVLAGATAAQIKTGQDSTYTGLAPTFPYAYAAGDRIFVTFTYLNLGQPNANIDVFCKDN